MLISRLFEPSVTCLLNHASCKRRQVIPLAASIIVSSHETLQYLEFLGSPLYLKSIRKLLSKVFIIFFYVSTNNINFLLITVQVKLEFSCMIIVSSFATGMQILIGHFISQLRKMFSYKQPEAYLLAVTNNHINQIVQFTLRQRRRRMRCDYY